jgi:hypothetical protein
MKNGIFAYEEAWILAARTARTLLKLATTSSKCQAHNSEKGTRRREAERAPGCARNLLADLVASSDLCRKPDRPLPISRWRFNVESIAGHAI